MCFTEKLHSLFKYSEIISTKLCFHVEMFHISVFFIIILSGTIGFHPVHAQLTEFADVVFTDEGIMTPV
jgi:hypothetical protein